MYNTSSIKEIQLRELSYRYMLNSQFSTPWWYYVLLKIY